MAWQVLVVDDEPLNLEIIGEYLDDDAFALTYAVDGEDAWEKLRAAPAPIDLILLDRMMPRLNGIDFLRRIKAQDEYRDVPVIMQTAADSPTQVREGMAAGAYYYLTKPYEAKVLLGIVRAALDDMAERRQAARDVAASEFVLGIGDTAEFEFRTLVEAHTLAGRLAGLCEEGAPVAMGLTELLVNAIEHGNLGITYAEKKALRLADGWEDEVERRLGDPAMGGRRAHIRITRTEADITFCVEDQGNGFDWGRYLSFDPERAFDPNGRGIAMARQAGFSTLEYSGRGNVVRATARARRGGAA